MKTQSAIRSLFFVFAALLAIGSLYQLEIVSAAGFLRNPNADCPFGSSVASLPVFERQAKAENAYRAASKVIRRDGRFELLSTPEGEFWIPAGSGEEVAFDLAEQSRKIYEWDGVGVRAGDVVLDCGANIGLYTRTALRSGASKVIAIEPVPDNAECIRRNHAAEVASGRVTVVEKGVWDKDDFLELNLSPDNAAAHTFLDSRARPGSAKVRLPLTTVDRIVAELKLAKVDFIKTDIEGAERNALAGARATIARFKPRMALSVYHLPDDPAVITRRVMEARADYLRACGPCMFNGKRFAPQVFFFR
jgi:FkbM family methyltransferase